MLDDCCYLKCQFSWDVKKLYSDASHENFYIEKKNRLTFNLLVLS